jgi:hypothetical protein
VRFSETIHLLQPLIFLYFSKTLFISLKSFDFMAGPRYNHDYFPSKVVEMGAYQLLIRT